MEKILAIIIAVIGDRWSEQLTDQQLITRCRSVGWLKLYLSKILALLSRLGVSQSYLIIFVLLAPLCLGAVLVQQLMMHLLTKILGSLLFAILTLLYFLGNREDIPNYSDFVLAHERNFGILFWFALLGPVGALIYWFLVVSRQTDDIAQNNSDLYAALTTVHAIFAWVPARITGFVYALLGNFISGFSCWITCMRSGRMQCSDVLDNCGKASIDAASADEESNLVFRAYIAWAVLSMLIVVVLRAIFRV